MKKIILDTNFLLIPGIFKIDVFSEFDRIMDSPFEVCILDLSLDELNNIINNQKAKHRQAAKLARSIIEHKNLKIIKQKSLYMQPDSKKLVVDDILVKISDKNCIIATQDKELQKRLRKKKIGYIILRAKNFLEIKDVL